MKAPGSLVYFDSAIFIDLLSPKSPKRQELGQLLTELKRDRIRIYTSVLAIQETNVLSFRAGRPGRDTTTQIDKVARIVGIDRNTALLAAKIEAQLLDTSSAHPDDQLKTRRKWDCFHIATAMSLKCSVLYTPDERFRKLAHRVTLEGLRLMDSKPSAGTLSFPAANLIKMSNDR